MMMLQHVDERVSALFHAAHQAVTSLNVSRYINTIQMQYNEACNNDMKNAGFSIVCVTNAVLA